MRLRVLLVGAALAVSVFPVAARAAATCTPAPPTIPADGSVDVTEPLQAFLDSVPDGGCAALKKNGTYRVEGELRLEDRHGFMLDGNGAAIFRTAPGPILVKGALVHLRVLYSEDVQVRRLSITGANPTGGWTDEHEGEAGVAVVASDDVTLRNLTIRDTFGDGVYLAGQPLEPGSGDPEVPATNVVVEGVAPGAFTVDSAGRCIVAISNAQHVVIRNVTGGDAARSWLNLEADREDVVIDDVLLEDSVAGHAPLNFVGMGGRGVRSNVTIRNNYLAGMSMFGKLGDPGVDPPDRFAITYDGNESAVPHLGNAALVSLNGVDGLTFVNNVQPFDGNAVVLSLSTSCGVFAADNQLFGALALFGGTYEPGCAVDGGGNEL